MFRLRENDLLFFDFFLLPFSPVARFRLRFLVGVGWAVSLFEFSSSACAGSSVTLTFVSSGALVSLLLPSLVSNVEYESVKGKCQLSIDLCFIISK